MSILLKGHRWLLLQRPFQTRHSPRACSHSKSFANISGRGLPINGNRPGRAQTGRASITSYPAAAECDLCGHCAVPASSRHPKCKGKAVIHHFLKVGVCNCFFLKRCVKLFLRIRIAQRAKPSIWLNRQLEVLPWMKRFPCDGFVGETLGRSEERTVSGKITSRF